LMLVSQTRTVDSRTENEKLSGSGEIWY